MTAEGPTVREPAWRAAVPLAAAGVAALTLATWWAAVAFGTFTLDDDAYVFANAHIARLDWTTVRWALLSQHEGNWNPLSWLSHALDRAAWGDRPAGHHATSVVLHALDAALAVLAVQRILALWLDGRAALMGAVLAGLLFGLHPVQAESVVWIAQRKTLLATFFSLLTVLAWTAWRDNGRRSAFALALVACAAALMSKGTAIGLPLVLLALGGRGRPVREVAPFAALAGATVAITLLASRLSGGLGTNAAIPLDERLPGMVKALEHDGFVLLWPRAAAAFHPLPSGLSLLDPSIVLSLVALALTGLLVWGERRRRPWLAVGAVWVLAGLLPTLGLVRVGLPILTAERYLHLPLLGIGIMLAGELVPWLGRRRWVGVLSAAALALVLLSSQRPALESWRDNVSVWSHAVARHPEEHPLPYALLGQSLRADDRPAEALAECEHALALRPDHRKGVVCKAQALSALRRWEESLPYFDAALGADGTDAALFNDRGVALLALRRFAAAEQDFRRALALGADDVRPYYNLSVALSAQGHLAEACAHLERATERGLATGNRPTPDPCAPKTR